MDKGDKFKFVILILTVMIILIMLGIRDYNPTKSTNTQNAEVVEYCNGLYSNTRIDDNSRDYNSNYLSYNRSTYYFYATDTLYSVEAENFYFNTGVEFDMFVKDNARIEARISNFTCMKECDRDYYCMDNCVTTYVGNISEVTKDDTAKN